MPDNDITVELFTTAKTYEGGGRVLIMNGVDKSKPDYKAIRFLQIKRQRGENLPAMLAP